MQAHWAGLVRNKMAGVWSITRHIWVGVWSKTHAILWFSSVMTCDGVWCVSPLIFLLKYFCVCLMLFLSLELQNSLRWSFKCWYVLLFVLYFRYISEAIKLLIFYKTSSSLVVARWSGSHVCFERCFVNNLQNEIITDIDLHSANYYGKHRDPISKLLKNLGMKLGSLVMIDKVRGHDAK